MITRQVAAQPISASESSGTALTTREKRRLRDKLRLLIVQTPSSGSVNGGSGGCCSSTQSSSAPRPAAGFFLRQLEEGLNRPHHEDHVPGRSNWPNAEFAGNHLSRNRARGCRTRNMLQNNTLMASTALLRIPAETAACGFAETARRSCGRRSPRHQSLAGSVARGLCR